MRHATLLGSALLSLLVGPAASADEGGFRHEGVHDGPSLEIGPALHGSTVLSPAFGLRFAVDAAIGQDFYFRLEPGFSTFSRKAVSTVPVSVDTTRSPAVITQQEITNKVRVFDLSSRFLLGYDFSSRVTARLGFLLGFALSSTSASQCSDNGRNGPMYGGSLSPVTVRLGEARAVELGLVAEIAWRTLPRCGVSVPGDLTVAPNALTSFTPRTADETIGVGAVSLQATYMFW